MRIWWLLPAAMSASPGRAKEFAWQDGNPKGDFNKRQGRHPSPQGQIDRYLAAAINPHP
jgi:hypothetical protein